MSQPTKRKRMKSPDVEGAVGSSPVDKRQVLIVFAGLVVAMLLSSLDQTVFATALPTMVGDLGGIGQMLWVTTAYILAATIMMPIYGKLGDLVGRKYLLLAALVAFLAGSLVGGMSTNMVMLIAARAIQGLGGGGLIILAQTIIADVVPPRQRAKYMGAMGAVFAIASVAGPLLGGWFTDGIGWRWAFWMNVPLSILAIATAAIFLKVSKERPARPRVDWCGIALMVVAVSSLVIMASWAGTRYAWDSVPVISLIAVSAVAWMGFVFAERRAVEPIIPLHLFRDRDFDLVTIAGLFAGVAVFGAITYTPSYIQMVTGLNATNASLLMLPLLVSVMLTSLAAGGLASRTGRYKWMPICGSMLGAFGLYLMSTLGTDASPWRISSYLLVVGIGFGLAMQILVVVVQNLFPITEVGTATASNNFFRELGGALGGAIVGTLYTSRLLAQLAVRLSAAPGASGAVPDANSLTPAYVHQLPATIKAAVVTSYNEALTPVYFYLVPLILLGTVLLLFLREKPLARTNAESGKTADKIRHEPRAESERAG